MPYRDSAKETKVESFVVAYDERRSTIFAYVLFASMALFGAVANYQVVEIECTRTAPRATPHCVAHSGLLQRKFAFEYYSPASLAVAERRGRKSSRYEVLTTPGGDLDGAKYDSREIAREGADYLANPDRISWDVKYTEATISKVFLGVGALVLAIFFAATRPKRVVLDHFRRTITVGRRRPLPLDSVAAVTVGALPKTQTRTVLVVTTLDGEDRKLVDGSDESIRPIETAIRAFITKEA